MSNISLLSQQVEIMYGRLSNLYRSVNHSSSPELLPVALKELGIASEKLQLMMQELTRQNEQLAQAQRQIDAEKQRYHSLFESVPEAYLVTDAAGTIWEANRAAVSLLNTPHPSLLKKAIANFIAPEARSLFQEKLMQLAQRQRLDFSILFQQPDEKVLEVAVTVSTVNDPDSHTPVLRWLLRDLTERKRAEMALEQADYDPCQDRSLVSYSRGDLIPLDPQVIWLVNAGAVKLTTLSDSGEEVLVGLVGKGMVFGTGLTALQTYQATALSDLQIAALPHSEIAQSPRLAQVLLPLINQRLRQTESFLAIYVHIRVEDRLQHFLRLVKQEIGQPVEQGIRLSARLTHQDLASACCTTRVTITRLLSRLQQQGKIAIDAQNYLILKE